MESLTVCFVGTEQSGKTGLIIRILFDEFEESYAATVEDSYRNTFVHGYKEYQIDFLDVAGTDIYQSEYDRWFSASDAFVYVFSVADQYTFVGLKNFYNEIKRVKEKQGKQLSAIPMILVGTHLDVDRTISEGMGKKMAETLGVPFFETSSKLDDITELKSTSTCLLNANQVIHQLLQEKIRREALQKLDSLEIPKLGLDKKKKVMSPAPVIKRPKERKGSKASIVSMADMVVPVVPILQELIEKWSKTIDKTPVYIDLPRLANKIVVIVGQMTPTPQPSPTITKSNPIETKVKPLSKARSQEFPQTLPELLSSNEMSKRKGSPLILSKNPKENKKDKDTKKTKEQKKEEEKLKKLEKERKKIRKENKKVTMDHALVESTYKIGMKVKFPKDPEFGVGIIRYVGPLKGKDYGPYLGVELEEPKGEHNGTYKGHTYFTCADNHGIMISPDFTSPNFTKELPSKYSGGWIRSSYGEEWTYTSDGTLECNDWIKGKHIVYTWDGEILKPREEGSPSFGAGQWNGEYILWFKKDWLVFKTTSRVEDVKYTWVEEKKEYVPSPLKSKEFIPNWSWKDDTTLVASDNSGYWKVEASKKIPKEVIIFLQCARYIRFGFTKIGPVTLNDNTTSSSPITMWEPVIELSGRSFEARVSPVMTVGNLIKLLLTGIQGDQDLGAYLKDGGLLMSNDQPISYYSQLSKPNTIIEVKKLEKQAQVEEKQEDKSKEEDNKPVATIQDITSLIDDIEQLIAEEPIKTPAKSSQEPTPEASQTYSSKIEKDDVPETSNQTTASSETQIEDEASSENNSSAPDSIPEIEDDSAEESEESDVEPEDSNFIKLQCLVKNWNLVIEIPDNFTIAQLMKKISKGATKKMGIIEARLKSANKKVIDGLDKLIDYVENENVDEAKSLVKQLVDDINKRIEEGELIAEILSQEEEQELLDVCDEMNEIPRTLLKVTIDALRNPGIRDYMQALRVEIGVTKKYISRISIGETLLIVDELQTEEGVSLNKEDIISNVLQDDSSIVALFDYEKIEQVKKEKEERRKHKETLRKERREKEELRRKQEEEKKIRKQKADEEARLRAEEEAARKAKEDQEIEQQQQPEKTEDRWDLLFQTLQLESNSLSVIKTEQPQKSSESNSTSSETKDTQSQENTDKSSQTSLKDAGRTQSTLEKKFIGDTMREILCDLALKFGENELEQQIRSQFGEFVKQGGDTSRQLFKFLQSVLNENSKVCRVLKAITQSIIASPFIRLKYAFNSYPFEDISGKWRIVVNIVPDKEVLVIHEKSGASKEDPPNGGYEFQWELRMKFDWDLKIMEDASLLMKGVTFKAGISESVKKEVQHTIDTFQCK